MFFFASQRIYIFGGTLISFLLLIFVLFYAKICCEYATVFPLGVKLVFWLLTMYVSAVTDCFIMVVNVG